MSLIEVQEIIVKFTVSGRLFKFFCFFSMDFETIKLLVL